KIKTKANNGECKELHDGKKLQISHKRFIHHPFTTILNHKQQIRIRVRRVRHLGGSTRPDSSPELRPMWRQPRRPVAALPSVNRRRGDASSLPVNIPDWSKILRQEYSKSGEFDGGNDGRDNSRGGDDEDDDDEWVPPHEYLARTRMASFSVHEGVGRTLKGRDLKKVRNAIWEKTGFQD
ncbi:Altered inheritance of mitochondria protein 3, partial [Bienertia sinuspersici]